jgi:hypothetical protein
MPQIAKKTHELVAKKSKAKTFDKSSKNIAKNQAQTAHN